MNIYEKLSEIQAKLKAPKSQYNSFGKYNYRNAEDILEAIDPFHAPQYAAPISSCAPQPAPPAQDAAPPPKATRAAPAVAPERVISREEAAVLAVVTDAPQTLDALARATALPITQLASVLVQLRLKERVRQLPGNRVCRR